MPGPGAVVVAEPVAIDIAPLAVLGAPRLKFQRTAVRIKAEVVRAERHALAGLVADQIAAAVAIGAVEPAVEAEAEAIHQVLRIAVGEAAEPGLAAVANAIAIRVLGKQDLGDVGDEDAVFPRHQTRRMPQAVEEDGGLVVHAVAVRVLEDLHPAGLQVGHPLLPDLAVAGRLARRKGVVAHLHHPEAAARVPVEIDRILDQRFVGDQTRLVARLDLQGGQGGLGRHRRRAGHAQQLGPCHPGATVGGHQIESVKAGAGVAPLVIRQQRQAVGVPCPALAQHLGPADLPLDVFLLDRIVQKDPVAARVGDHQIVMAIAIEVEEAGATVAGDFRLC